MGTRVPLPLTAAKTRETKVVAAIDFRKFVENEFTKSCISHRQNRTWIDDPSVTTVGLSNFAVTESEILESRND